MGGMLGALKEAPEEASRAAEIQAAGAKSVAVPRRTESAAGSLSVRTPSSHPADTPPSCSSRPSSRRPRSQTQL